MIDVRPNAGDYIYRVAAQLVGANGSGAVVSGDASNYLRGTLTAVLINK
jgi:hypothetical protein